MPERTRQEPDGWEIDQARRMLLSQGFVVLTAEEAETVRAALNAQALAWTLRTLALALLGGHTLVTRANPHETKTQQNRENPASGNPHEH